MNLKGLIDQIGSKAKNFFSFMNPVTWMGVAAFAFGFWVGSEGDWIGTIFFSIVWMVGLWILTKFQNVNNR